MPPINIPKKYLTQFIDEGRIRKLINDRGTMPADLRLMRTIIQERLSDRRFLETFVNDVIQTGQIRVSLK